MSKRFTITEEDRRHILSLYGLIGEAIDPNAGGTQSFAVNFKAGWYDPKNPDAYIEGQKKLTDEIDTFVKTQLIPYLQKVPSSIVGMTFRSGESLIPNTDNEGKDKGKGQPLDPGRLSDLRKFYLEEYLKSVVIPQIQAVDKQAQIPPLVYEKLEPKEPWIGKNWCKNPSDEVGRSCLSAWKSQGYPDRDKYNQDQKSEFLISVQPITSTTTPTPTPTPLNEECLTNLSIQIYVDSHSCQNAEFFVFANDTILYNTQGGYTANMNNASSSRGIPTSKSLPRFYPNLLNPGYGYLKNGDGKKGSYKYNDKNTKGDLGKGRSDTFVITSAQSKEIVKAGKTKFGNNLNIFMYATTNPAHSDICNAVITKSDGTVVYDKRLLGVKGRVLTLDLCGNEVLPIPGDTSEPDMSAWIQKLVQDRSQAQTESESNQVLKKLFQSSKLDSKALLQEHVFAIKSKIGELVKYLKPFHCGDPTVTFEDAQNKINEYINVFENMLIGKDEKGGEVFEDGLKYDFRQNIEGKRGYEKFTYKDAKFAQDSMMGDVRYQIETFYKIFALICWYPGMGIYAPQSEEQLRDSLSRLARKKELLSEIGVDYSC